jgi:hypothetical protein
MIRFALVLLFVLPSSLSLAQIELSFVSAKTIVGATNPELLPGGRILMEGDSAPAVSEVAIIRVACVERVRLRAQKSIKEHADLILISESTDEVSKIVTARYLLAGEGSYVIDAISFSWDRSLNVSIGPDPIPEPKPNPPKPDIDVSNVYHVGLVAYTQAPPDAATAKTIARIYSVNADKLFGIGGIADIQIVLKLIDVQFATKQCTSKEACEKWDVWKRQVNEALKKEQLARGSFTRQDFYSALNEIAKALESIR